MTRPNVISVAYLGFLDGGWQLEISANNAGLDGYGLLEFTSGWNISCSRDEDKEFATKNR